MSDKDTVNYLVNLYADHFTSVKQSAISVTRSQIKGYATGERLKLRLTQLFNDAGIEGEVIHVHQTCIHHVLDAKI